MAGLRKGGADREEGYALTAYNLYLAEHTAYTDCCCFWFGSIRLCVPELFYWIEFITRKRLAPSQPKRVLFDNKNFIYRGIIYCYIYTLSFLIILYYVQF